MKACSDYKKATQDKHIDYRIARLPRLIGGFQAKSATIQLPLRQQIEDKSDALSASPPSSKR